MHLKLSNYYHNREERVNKSVPRLFRFIEKFSEQETIKKWFLLINKKLNLPENVISQYYKKYLADNFNYLPDKGFNKKLYLRNLPFASVKYFLFIFYIFFKRSFSDKNSNNYELIIDNIEWEGDLVRYSKLISFFKKDKVLVIIPNSLKTESNNVIIENKIRYKNYKITIKESLSLLLTGLNILFLSFKSRMNLFGVSSQIVNSYYYYYSIFIENNSRFLINHQHYHTDSIKNYLFKKMGGDYSAVIQKNIHQQGHNGFYYDADLFFTIGNITGDRPQRYGARLGITKPIGSFFMEHHFFNQINIQNNDIPFYDVLCLGYNVFNQQNIYDKYFDDYYEHFKWLVKLSNKHPELKIGIAHHTNNIKDPIEMKIISGSNVERINPKIDSYSLGFKSGINVTFGSSMGYEFIGHNIPCLFLDPGFRNTQYLPDGNELKDLRVSSFTDFENTVLSRFSEKNKKINLNSEDFCLNSEEVSSKIYKNFNNLINK